jgi:hypothetical protein
MIMLIISRKYGIRPFGRAVCQARISEIRGKPIGGIRIKSRRRAPPFSTIVNITVNLFAMFLALRCPSRGRMARIVLYPNGHS